MGVWTLSLLAPGAGIWAGEVSKGSRRDGWETKPQLRDKNKEQDFHFGKHQISGPSPLCADPAPQGSAAGAPSSSQQLRGSQGRFVPHPKNIFRELKP